MATGRVPVGRPDAAPRRWWRGGKGLAILGLAAGAPVVAMLLLATLGGEPWHDPREGPVWRGARGLEVRAVLFTSPPAADCLLLFVTVKNRGQSAYECPAWTRDDVRLRDDGRWVWHWDPRFMSVSPDETRASFASSDRLKDAARNLSIPTLLVRGRMSDLLSEEGAKELLELVPHAQYADVAGAGHMVAGDRNDLFNDAIAGFLDDLR